MRLEVSLHHAANVPRRNYFSTFKLFKTVKQIILRKFLNSVRLSFFVNWHNRQMKIFKEWTMKLAQESWLFSKSIAEIFFTNVKYSIFFSQWTYPDSDVRYEIMEPIYLVLSGISRCDTLPGEDIIRMHYATQVLSIKGGSGSFGGSQQEVLNPRLSTSRISRSRVI